MSMELNQHQSQLAVPVVIDSKFITSVKAWNSTGTDYTNLHEFTAAFIRDFKKEAKSNNNVRRLLCFAGPPTAGKSKLERHVNGAILRTFEENLYTGEAPSFREIPTYLVRVPWMETSEQAKQLGLLSSEAEAGYWSAEDIEINSNVLNRALEVTLLTNELPLPEGDKHIIAVTDVHLCTAIEWKNQVIVGKNRGYSAIRRFQAEPVLKDKVWIAYTFSDRTSHLRRLTERMHLSTDPDELRQLMAKGGTIIPEDVPDNLVEEYAKSGRVKAVEAVWNDMKNCARLFTLTEASECILKRRHLTKEEITLHLLNNDYDLLRDIVVNGLYPYILEGLGIPNKRRIIANTSDSYTPKGKLKKIKETPGVGYGIAYNLATPDNSPADLFMPR